MQNRKRKLYSFSLAVLSCPVNSNSSNGHPFHFINENLRKSIPFVKLYFECIPNGRHNYNYFRDTHLVYFSVGKIQYFYSCYIH